MTDVTATATDVTKNKLCRGVVGEISKVGKSTDSIGKSEPTWLISGDLQETKDQLSGWDRVPVGGFGWHMDETTDVAVFEWVVAEKGDYEVTVHHERAGRINVTIKV